MEFVVIVLFLLGYLGIVFEQQIRLNKAASALITGVTCWLVFFVQSSSPELASSALLHHLGEISAVLFFLLGAMTIVELIDLHDGFDVLQQTIHSTRQSRLVWIVSAISFALSAVLDNLTTAIVMCTLSQKLLSDSDDRRWFAAVIIISSNAGGAWSPIGDVTTSMLWIGGQISAIEIVRQTFIPSLAVALLPTIIIARILKGRRTERDNHITALAPYSRLILTSGLLMFVFVPLFKALTHMPPFAAMLLALGFMWLITTIVHRNKSEAEQMKYSVARALQRIDSPSILFFLGILLAVSSLQTFGTLARLAQTVDTIVSNDFLVGALLGLTSAVIDNIPLVAAAQGMYSLNHFGPNHPFWTFLALSTGTGGSIIIIGSAAGIAVMGMENIRFGWYVRNVSWIAFSSFVLGLLVYVGQYWLLN